MSSSDLGKTNLHIYLPVTLHTLIELFGEFKLFILLLLHDDNPPDKLDTAVLTAHCYPAKSR